MKWLKRMLCHHNYKHMDGLMGFFCKIQCTKCGKIDNDFSNAVYSHFQITVIKEASGE